MFSEECGRGIASRTPRGIAPDLGMLIRRMGTRILKRTDILKSLHRTQSSFRRFELDILV